jgi:hypothetical protein
MDFIILRKKIDGFRLGNGQLQNVPPELLWELRQAWENFSGPVEEFRRGLGMKVGTLRKLLSESKKLNHALASASAMGISEPGAAAGTTESTAANTGGQLEIAYDNGSKIIRFPNIELLLEFLKKAA